MYKGGTQRNGLVSIEKASQNSRDLCHLAQLGIDYNFHLPCCTEPEDYTENSFTLTFDEDTSRVCRAIPITDDEEPEPLLEQFNVTVTSNDPPIVFMPPMATVTIEDDDGESTNRY